MNKIILSNIFLLVFTSCLKTQDNTKAVIIDPVDSYSQWKEVKRYYVGWSDIKNGNILTILADSSYYYHPDNLVKSGIDSVGVIKVDDGKFSFISPDKKDTSLFFYTMRNDTLHLTEPLIIEQHIELIYTRVH